MVVATLKSSNDCVVASILDVLPEGWRYADGAQTAPRGYRWANNGKSRFKPGFERALVKEDGHDDNE